MEIEKKVNKEIFVEKVQNVDMKLTKIVRFHQFGLFR
jgi:hypothetical protein